MARRTRRVDGRHETPADTRFFDLREAGYRGGIDQDGDPAEWDGKTRKIRKLRPDEVPAKYRKHMRKRGR